MQTLGDYLKKGRESRNISLSDVSDYTKISKIYLDCLENDDYSTIPAEPYVKGYISSYASCVGVDEHKALKLYDSFQIETSDAEKIQFEILHAKKNSVPLLPRLNKKIWFVLALCMVIFLAIGGYYSFFENQKKAAVNQTLKEQNKTKAPTPISRIESNHLQKRPDGNSFQSKKQDSFERKIESKAAGTKPGDNISQISAPLDLQGPGQDSKNAVPHQPIHEFSRVKDLSGSENNQLHFENNLKVIEAAACSSIKNRIPQGIGEFFEWSLDKIFIWTRIECESPPSSIRHIYYFKGEKVNDILLNIRSSHWRTWSYKTLANKRYIGPWRVDITSVDGKLFQSIHFEIK